RRLLQKVQAANARNECAYVIFDRRTRLLVGDLDRPPELVGGSRTIACRPGRGGGIESVQRPCVWVVQEGLSVPLDPLDVRTPPWSCCLTRRSAVSHDTPTARPRSSRQRKRGTEPSARPQASLRPLPGICSTRVTYRSRCENSRVLACALLLW